MKKKKTIKNILAHTVLTLLAIVWVSPLVWIILTSFRAQCLRDIQQERQICL